MNRVEIPKKTRYCAVFVADYDIFVSARYSQIEILGMRLFGITVNGVVKAEVYTTLKMACEAAGVSYSAASKGKRVFVETVRMVVITELNVVKMVGRENNLGKSNLKYKKAYV